jgi:hypothetical protein
MVRVKSLTWNDWRQTWLRWDGPRLRRPDTGEALAELVPDLASGLFRVLMPDGRWSVAVDRASVRGLAMIMVLVELDGRS